MEESVKVIKYKKYMYDGDNKDFNNQVIYRFENGYGASVINGKGSCGLELLQIYFPDSKTDEYILGSEQQLT